MRLVEHDPTTDLGRSRHVVTRDLLRRAARAEAEEAHACQFQALHLNLPLLSEILDRLGLRARERARADRVGMAALAEAIAAFDPYGRDDFDTVATAYVVRSLRARLTHRSLVRRVALVVAGVHA
jgi:DNA-directed RNA polymerase specialized sigma subunit